MNIFIIFNIIHNVGSVMFYTIFTIDTTQYNTITSNLLSNLNIERKSCCLGLDILIILFNILCI